MLFCVSLVNEDGITVRKEVKKEERQEQENEQQQERGTNEGYKSTVNKQQIGFVLLYFPRGGLYLPMSLGTEIIVRGILN